MEGYNFEIFSNISDISNSPEIFRNLNNFTTKGKDISMNNSRRFYIKFLHPFKLGTFFRAKTPNLNIEVLKPPFEKKHRGGVGGKVVRCCTM